jgi:8-oxo-dGTP pyrophosphatase MutT (NUDIX family)
MAKDINAGVLIKSQDTDKVLLLKRSELVSEHPLTWALVSGGVDEGETPLEGLMREVTEETQFDGTTLDYTFIKIEETETAIFHYFEALTPTEFTPILDAENLDYKWVHGWELPEPLYPDVDNKIYDRKRAK